MDLYALRKLLGITPDINKDFIDQTQINEDLLNYYKLIKENKLYNKTSKISKSFYTVQKYEMLLEKKNNGILTVEEQKLFDYLAGIINGI